MENQKHGFLIENRIKRSFRIQDKIGYTSKWDMPSIKGSIKTTGSNIVYLGDATRIWEIECCWILIVARYKQEKEKKIFFEIREYHIDKEETNTLRGNLPMEEVKRFHSDLGAFPEGSHIEAQQFHRHRKKEIKDRYNSVIKLNPKVDSKKQRRLQCSVSIDDLDMVIKPNIYTKTYRGIKLPLEIKSKRRNEK